MWQGEASGLWSGRGQRCSGRRNKLDEGHVEWLSDTSEYLFQGFHVFSFGSFYLRNHLGVQSPE